MFKVNPEQIYSIFFFGNDFHFAKATWFKVFFALDTKRILKKYPVMDDYCNWMFWGPMEKAIPSKGSDDECNVRLHANLLDVWFQLWSKFPNFKATYQCLCGIDWYFSLLRWRTSQRVNDTVIFTVRLYWKELPLLRKSWFKEMVLQSRLYWAIEKDNIPQKSITKWT